MKEWSEVRKELFTEEEIRESDLRVASLSDLIDALYELFPLHRIHLRYAGKMLRSERRYPLKGKFLSRHADRITYGKDARIKHAYDITGIRLIDHMSLLRHHLLRL